tara:strand:- start:153 stop:293 length:141 start_codon:yes stop_codon:yes gene_type:complete
MGPAVMLITIFIIIVKSDGGMVVFTFETIVATDEHGTAVSHSLVEK